MLEAFASTEISDRNAIIKRRNNFFITKPFVLFKPANNYIATANKEGHKKPSLGEQPIIYL
ncbi:MAG: hypothetical protein WBV81_15880 [Ignavibacteriaceae bacterium]